MHGSHKLYHVGVINDKKVFVCSIALAHKISILYQVTLIDQNIGILYPTLLEVSGSNSYYNYIMRHYIRAKALLQALIINIQPEII